MNIYLYDKTFDGLLSVIFYSLKTRIEPDLIIGSLEYQSALFANTYEIETNQENADNIWNAFEQKTSYIESKTLFYVYLSEINDIEMLIYRYMKYIFSKENSVTKNYREMCILEIRNIRRKVLHEAHRMISFVRFQKTKELVYFAVIDPMYDVLKIIGKHFERRFANQKWIIYDTKRKYGLYYDGKELQEIKFSDIQFKTDGVPLAEEQRSEYDTLIEKSWKQYYQSINIKERKNTKMHLRLLPKRYWKYLPEKNVLDEDL